MKQTGVTFLSFLMDLGVSYKKMPFNLHVYCIFDIVVHVLFISTLYNPCLQEEEYEKKQGERTDEDYYYLSACHCHSTRYTLCL